MTAIVRDLEHKINWVESGKDWAFREALLRGAPDSVRPLFKQALGRLPKANGADFSREFFGAELPAILVRTAPLVGTLHVYMHRNLNLPGLIEWLTATGYGNDYRMIQAFAAWADLAASPAPANAAHEPGHG